MPLIMGQRLQRNAPWVTKPRTIGNNPLDYGAEAPEKCVLDYEIQDDRIITILLGCTKKTSVDVLVEKNKLLVQRYFDEMNKGNESYLDEYFGANYVYHGFAGDLDAEGFKAQHDMFLTAFPDTKASVEDIIAVGDKVVTRWKIRGTHSGELQGIAPTGKEVTITGIIITRVDNGKAVEEWEALDQLGLLQQLGAIPLP